MNTNPETIESMLARLLDDMEFFGLIKLMPGEAGGARESQDDRRSRTRDWPEELHASPPRSSLF
jgi:hypothetical protein